jgi:hypothetical protein
MLCVASKLIMLSVVMLNVVMLNVVMLSVVAQYLALTNTLDYYTIMKKKFFILTNFRLSSVACITQLLIGEY